MKKKKRKHTGDENMFILYNGYKLFLPVMACYIPICPVNSVTF